MYFMSNCNHLEITQQSIGGDPLVALMSLMYSCLQGIKKNIHLYVMLSNCFKAVSQLVTVTIHSILVNPD